MLYPPYIEGTIPSFYGDSLTVPFSMNKSVGSNEIKGFSIKIKTIQNTKYLFTTTTYNYNATSDYYAKFKLTLDEINKLKIGQYYKIQIAYIDLSGEVGYYSTVGIVKYTTKPQVSIKGLRSGRLNGSLYNYIGEYSQAGQDTTEKVYKYNFQLMDKNKEIIEETGWKVHNTNNDNSSYLSYDEFSIAFDLEKNESYYIQYSVITNNKMGIKSPKYRISSQKSIDPDAKLQLYAENKQDNGYVLLTMSSEYDKYNNEIPFSGGFLISRTCEDTQFKKWEEVFRFQSKNSYASKWSWKDFTVEQGKEYIYAIQQYNDFNVYTDRLCSNKVYADFVDVFLYDGKRQLKIAYNPKIASFKSDVLETKTDTIGSQYPFFFRNGNVDYKEFSINGLISYLSDEERLFLTDKELGLSSELDKIKRISTVDIKDEPSDKEYEKLDKKGINIKQLKKNYEETKCITDLMQDSRLRTTQLTNYNYAAERIFKLEVLKWLNNGEPKLFRSPSEGNYLVRLMNVSLSPEDGLGRMLHSFSCTAYEIDKYDFETLNVYDIISKDVPIIKVLRFKSVQITGTTNNLLGKDTALRIQLTDMSPGDLIEIEADGGNQTIIIGSTGTYQLEDDTNITSVKLSESTAEKYKNQTLNAPMLTYGFYDDSLNSLDNIVELNFEDYPVRQFVGPIDDILDKINNVKNNIISFYYLHFYKRDIENMDAMVGFDQDYNYMLDLSSYSNYLPIYQFSTPKLNGLDCWGLEEIALKEDDFRLKQTDFEDPDLKGRYRYYIKTNGIYEPAFSWDENATYYARRDFILYKDLRFDTIYVDESCWSQLQAELDEDVLSNYQLYETIISIDNNIVDLMDINDYDINGPINFNSINTSIGIVLECGYNYRTTKYKVENTDSDLLIRAEQLNSQYSQLVDYVKNDENNSLIAYNKYQDYLNQLEIYYSLLNKIKEE